MKRERDRGAATPSGAGAGWHPALLSRVGHGRAGEKDPMHKGMRCVVWTGFSWCPSELVSTGQSRVSSVSFGSGGALVVTSSRKEPG